MCFCLSSEDLMHFTNNNWSSTTHGGRQGEANLLQKRFYPFTVLSSAAGQLRAERWLDRGLVGFSPWKIPRSLKLKLKLFLMPTFTWDTAQWWQTQHCWSRTILHSTAPDCTPAPHQVFEGLFLSCFCWVDELSRQKDMTCCSQHPGQQAWMEPPAQHQKSHKVTQLPVKLECGGRMGKPAGSNQEPGWGSIKAWAGAGPSRLLHPPMHDLSWAAAECWAGRWASAQTPLDLQEKEYLS